MLIPVGVDVSVPVSVVVLGEAVDVLAGTLVRLEEDRLHLVVRTRGLSEGTRLVVTVRDRTRLTGKVLRADDDHLVVSRDAAHTADDRAAPRVTGTVVARWRAVGDDAPAWLAGGEDPGPFVAFHGAAEVSVSGMLLGVDAAMAPPVGARLLLELTLGDGAPERAIGIVRRHARFGARARVAIEFAELPEGMLEALSTFTLANL